MEAAPGARCSVVRMPTNVVLICADQWRADCLSVAGHPDVFTPNLDQLAGRGVRAERAYSATPTCVPARMALMTGLKPSSHRRVGYIDGVEFDIETTLRQCLREAGYQTQAIGKMHYWPERGRIGFDDVMLHDGYLHHSRDRSRPVEAYDDYVPWLRDQADADAAADIIDDGLSCNAITARPWTQPERLHPTNWVATQAERWLYRRDPTTPFFLYLSFHRPHAPLDPPAWAFDRYARRDLAPPVRGEWTSRLDPWRDNTNPEALVADYRDDVVHEARAGYYGSISHVDAQIGRILMMLGEFGLADDTVVAFVSDHGDMMGDHGMWRKGYPYEGSSRVPFLLTGPGLPRGVVLHDLVELRDVMPTLLEAVGVPVPDEVEGRSVLALLNGETGRAHLHGEHTILGQSLQWIVTDQHKYVWWSGDGHEQLFDLECDPHEERDVASENPDVVHRCRGLLIAELAGRPYVRDGDLAPGQPASPLLPR